jgi:hypothetical protein
VARNTVLDNYDCDFYRVCLAWHSTHILIIAPSGRKKEKKKMKNSKLKKIFNLKLSHKEISSDTVKCVVLIIAILLLVAMLVVVVLLDNDLSQPAGSVRRNISEYGVYSYTRYYVYMEEMNNSGIYVYDNEIFISDTQLYYLEDEEAQSYITYDINKGGAKSNIKIYSTEKIK